MDTIKQLPRLVILDRINFHYKLHVLVIQDQLFSNKMDVVEVRPAHEQMQYLWLPIKSVLFDTKHE
jgi:hypothetical protein